ncbi:MAG: branched-chain amino acid ABC transporter permease [Persicimonas sp.]
MSSFLQLLLAGLALGSVYALVALGFVVIYRASQVFNFAQGELLTFGAFGMLTLLGMGVPWYLAVVGTMLMTGLLGAVIERLFLRPLVGRPVFVTIILTIFIGFILRTLMLVGWGSDSRGMPTPWDKVAAVEFGGASILVNSLASIGAGLVALLAFFLLIKYTRLGVNMRATASDQEVSMALGIPVGRILGATWFISGALAALGGVFLGMFPRSVDVHLGFIALGAFPAVIVGGLTSATGAVVAGFALGVLQVLTQGYVNEMLGDFGQNFHTVFPYVVMILFLMVRPYGLFGEEEVERV